MSRRLGLTAAALYAGCIVLANYAIRHWGTPPPVPQAPHTLPVWPGLAAPSGVYIVAVVLVLRNVIQRQLGAVAAVVAILVGAGLSAWTSGAALAEASAVAFLVSELLDMAVYTPLRARFKDSKGQLIAVLPASLAGGAVDSAVFLAIAFHSESFWRAQFIGKTWGVLAAALILLAIQVGTAHRLRLEVVPA